ACFRRFSPLTGRIINILHRLFGGPTVLHNRYLPDWVHRLANGAIGGVLSLLVTTAIVRILGTPLRTLWFALPVAVVCMALDPSRYSLVEGCAGDLGYDALLGDDSEKPVDSDWGEALDN